MSINLIENGYFKYILFLFLLVCAGCDGHSEKTYVDPSEAYKIFGEKVKCVALLNYHPNVEGAAKPLKIDPYLRALSDSNFYVLADTKVKNNRPDFYKAFVSYKSCEDTESKLRKNRKFGKCIISLKEIDLSDYQEFWETSNLDHLLGKEIDTLKGIRRDDPLKCKM